MEAPRKAGYGGIVNKEEKRVESDGDEGGCKEARVSKVGSERKDHDDYNMSPPSTKPNLKELIINCDKQVLVMTRMESVSAEPNSKASSSAQEEQDEQLESAKAEMGEVRQENQRLRIHLDKIMKDYQTLRGQFHDIVQQEAQKSARESNTNHKEMEETELVSLTLGRTLSNSKKDEKYIIPRNCKVNEQGKESLTLGLDCQYKVPKVAPAESSLINASPENSLEEVKGDARDTWPPQKTLKTMRSGDDEVSEQNPAKKTRVSVRIRCETPTMNDGCQWRKYGQKISKGNPCPRAYYRCTVAPNCPVRKQVQRCVEDMSILITTYEGTHNHQLPASATAMASTTSAAACMLMSGSSTSGSSPHQSLTTTTAATDLHGLNFYLSDNSKSKQFYLPNSSISSSHPTITLDLTSSSTSSSSSHFNRIPTNFTSRYPSTNLNFSSFESNPLPISWSTTNGVLSYGNGTQHYNNKNTIGSLSFGRQPQENAYQSYNMQKNILSTPSPNDQLLQPDTIAAATKALTSDPNFRSALAAALTSIISSSNGGVVALGNHAEGDKFVQNMKMGGELFPVGSNFPSTSNASKCSSGYLNKSTSTSNSQAGNLIFLPPSLPLSTSKSKSSSPGDDRDHIM